MVILNHFTRAHFSEDAKPDTGGHFTVWMHYLLQEILIMMTDSSVPSENGAPLAVFRLREYASNSGIY